MILRSVGIKVIPGDEIRLLEQRELLYNDAFQAPWARAIELAKHTNTQARTTMKRLGAG